MESVAALSTTEAEYISISSATQEAIRLRRLLQGLGLDISAPTGIQDDNQGKITISKNQTSYSRTKHIDVKFNFVREAVERGQVVFKYCPSEKMVTDILTKGLHKQKFEQF